jgi:hypothetical protein
MRTRIGVTALGAGLLLAAPAWAQVALTFGGADPTKIINQPVNTANSAVPIAQPQNLGSTFRALLDFMPKIQLPSANSVHGQSVFPTPSQMPGKNYLKQFGFQRAVPIQE